MDFKIFKTLNFPWYYLIPLFITSYFSVGFFHFDEHFQILEFANYKMGHSTVEELPWEFKEMIRPTLQPYITVVLWKLYDKIAFFNPFIFAFILRLITAIGTIFAFIGIQKSFLNNKNSYQIKFYYQIAFLLWFMPFVSVRYSSEVWSGLFLAYGMCIILIASKKGLLLRTFIGGLLLGCSFLFRFQVIFALAGLGLWILIIMKLEWKYIFTTLFGFVIIAFCGYLLDCDFYNKDVYTPYNYYYTNIVLKVSEHYGTYGLWYYPAMFLFHLFPFISIPLGYFILKYFKLQPKSVFTWIVLFFIIPHFIIKHKELRFLFPMFVFLPLLISFSVDKIIDLSYKYKRTYYSLITINLILLIMICFKPADINIYNLKVLTENGRYKNSIYIPKDIETQYFPGLKMRYYNCFTNDSTKALYHLDTKKPLNSQKRLIEDNHYKSIFWTKMGDDFEKFKYRKICK